MYIAGNALSMWVIKSHLEESLKCRSSVSEKKQNYLIHALVPGPVVPCIIHGLNQENSTGKTDSSPAKVRALLTSCMFFFNTTLNEAVWV